MYGAPGENREIQLQWEGPHHAVPPAAYGSSVSYEHRRVAGDAGGGEAGLQRRLVLGGERRVPPPHRPRAVGRAFAGAERAGVELRLHLSLPGRRGGEDDLGWEDKTIGAAVAELENLRVVRCESLIRPASGDLRLVLSDGRTLEVFTFGTIDPWVFTLPAPPILVSSPTAPGWYDAAG